MKPIKHLADSISLDLTQSDVQKRRCGRVEYHINERDEARRVTHEGSKISSESAWKLRRWNLQGLVAERVEENAG
jgi:hypothetical protein